MCHTEKIVTIWKMEYNLKNVWHLKRWVTYKRSVSQLEKYAKVGKMAHVKKCVRVGKMRPIKKKLLTFWKMGHT